VTGTKGTGQVFKIGKLGSNGGSDTNVGVLFAVLQAGLKTAKEADTIRDSKCHVL
jgi:hypothetical protein